MAPTPSARRETALLGALAVAAWVVRVNPFFRRDGVLGWPVDYDEGVYLAASRLLTRGVLPWRDFVFVHPPGVLAFLSPITLLELAPSVALAAARWMMATTGAVNVLLAALLVRRHAGLVGACVTAGLLAVWPELVVVDRAVHLEPLLATACLLFLHKAFADAPRPVTGGVFLGLALLVKSWAALWAVAWLVVRRRRALPGLVVALLVVAVVLAPVLVAFPEAWRQLGWFHLVRPPDGDASLAVRLTEMFVARSWLPLAALVVGAPALWWRRRDVFVQLVVLVLALVVAALLGASAYWNQYDAHLAVPFAMACGLAVDGVARRLLPGREVAVGLVAAVIAAAPGLVWVRAQRFHRDADQTARVAVLKAEQGVVCSFQPEELIMADHWPAVTAGGALVDPYGQGLLEALRSGQRFSSTAEALGSGAAQVTLRRQLVACPRWFLGWRGRAQLDAESVSLLRPEQLVPEP
jgi:hypothetical protein